jgi:hypothetical protein
MTLNIYVILMHIFNAQHFLFGVAYIKLNGKTKVYTYHHARVLLFTDRRIDITKCKWCSIFYKSIKTAHSTTRVEKCSVIQLE